MQRKFPIEPKILHWLNLPELEYWYTSRQLPYLQIPLKSEQMLFLNLWLPKILPLQTAELHLPCWTLKESTCHNRFVVQGFLELSHRLRVV
jgi:hypothetical protein